jgi:hypothetical protein
MTSTFASLKDLIFNQKVYLFLSGYEEKGVRIRNTTYRYNLSSCIKKAYEKFRYET